MGPLYTLTSQFFIMGKDNTEQFLSEVSARNPDPYETCSFVTVPSHATHRPTPCWSLQGVTLHCYLKIY